MSILPKQETRNKPDPEGQVSLCVLSFKGWFNLLNSQAGALNIFCQDRTQMVMVMNSSLLFFFFFSVLLLSFLIYTGLFKDCHTKVPPENFFESCVYDMCFTGGQETSLCYGLQAYAESCNNAGICIEWRNTTLCRECCDLQIFILDLTSNICTSPLPFMYVILIYVML